MRKKIEKAGYQDVLAEIEEIKKNLDKIKSKVSPRHNKTFDLKD
jgi:hypothetical protein